MLSKIATLSAIALMLTGLIAAPATAGVPRVVVAEGFGATW